MNNRRKLARVPYAIMAILPSVCLFALVMVFGYSINAPFRVTF